MSGDEPQEAPLEHRGPFGRLLTVAAGVGEAIARTAGAASELLVDGDLRRRSAQLIAANASKGLRGIQYGLQTGAAGIQKGLQTVGQGPRQVGLVLSRLQARVEEQRMEALIKEAMDAPTDVQVGFKL
jgi:hypothetical protein